MAKNEDIVWGGKRKEKKSGYIKEINESRNKAAKKRSRKVKDGSEENIEGEIVSHQASRIPWKNKLRLKDKKSTILSIALPRSWAQETQILGKKSKTRQIKIVRRTHKAHIIRKVYVRVSLQGFKGG